MQKGYNKISKSPWKIRIQLSKLREKISWVGRKKNGSFPKCKAIKPRGENIF